MRALLLVLLLFPAAFAQAGNQTSEGGNVSSVNSTLEDDSAWHGVCGQLSPSAAIPLALNATPGNVTCLTISTGSGACSAGIAVLNLIFSNSPSPIASLSPGNVAALEAFINSPAENGTGTLTLNSSFTTAGFGTIPSAPSVYTNSPQPGVFLMGYMNDQSGNIVIISPAVSDEPGFNGSLFDFQLMLPTQNATPTAYYLTVDLACNPEQPPPAGGGGGGTGTPFYNQTVPSPEAGPPANATEPCIGTIYCGEWGPCEADGFSYQRCADESGCSPLETFNVRACPPPGQNLTPPANVSVPPEVITPPGPQEPPYLCLAALLLLLLLAALYLRLSGITVFAGGKHISPSEAAFSPDLMRKYSLRAGDRVLLGYGGRESEAAVAAAPRELLDGMSPAYSRGSFVVLGDSVLSKLGIKLDKKRETKGRFADFTKISGLSLRKVD